MKRGDCEVYLHNMMLGPQVEESISISGMVGNPVQDFHKELPLSVTEHIRTLMRGDVEGRDLVDELSKMMDELPKSGEAKDTQQIRDSRVEIICSMGIIGTE